MKLEIEQVTNGFLLRDKDSLVTVFTDGAELLRSIAERYGLRHLQIHEIVVEDDYVIDWAGSDMNVPPNSNPQKPPQSE